MPGAFNLASLRTSLLMEAVRAPQPIASSSRLGVPASAAAFSTSSPLLVSRARRQLAKRKRTAHIAKREAMEAETSAGRADPVYGHIVFDEATLRDPKTASLATRLNSNPWQGSRLEKTLLRPEAVWAAPVPEYTAHAAPERYLPGLTSADQQVLFGALPHVSSALKISGETRTGAPAEEFAKSTVETQQKKVEMLQRILDLRNANKKGIEVYNRERVIEEFGSKDGEDRKGADTGSSAVQAALLTQKIRSLAAHLAANKRDVHNKRSLRQLVHDRAKMLKYYRRSNPGKTREEKEENYLQLLNDLGLQRRAVEGEIIL